MKIQGILHGFMETVSKALGETRSLGDTIPAIERQRLMDLLPYRLYTQEGFFQNTTSMGFILSASPLCGADDQMVNALAGAFREHIPEGAVVDIINWASPKVGPLLDEYIQARAGAAEIYHELARRRAEHFASATMRSLSPHQPICVRDFRIYISVALPLKSETGAKLKLKRTRDGLVATLRSIHVDTTPVGPSELISFLRELLVLNGTEREKPQYDDLRLLNQQISAPETLLEVHEDGLHINKGEYVARFYNVLEYPQVWPQWQMGDVIGSFTNVSQIIEGAFMTHFSFMMPEGDSKAASLKLKAFRGVQEAESPTAKYLPSLIERAKSLRWVSQKLEEGQKPTEIFYQVAVFARGEVIDAAETTLHSIYNSLGWKLEPLRWLALPAFMFSLPMMKAEKKVANEVRKLSLTRTMLTWTCANLAPLQGEWKGNGYPRQMLLGRRGQLFYFDPFSSKEGNYNVAIIGRSGSGKSVLMQDLVVSLVGSGGRVRVIDDGRSFMNTCLLLGGRFVEFTAAAGIKLNPFSLIARDGVIEEDADYLKDVEQVLAQIIELMVSPNHLLTNSERGLINSAVTACLAATGADTTITQLAAWFRENGGSTGNTFAMALVPYCEGGLYGHFFDGPLNIPLNNPLIVYELNELQTKPDLRAVVMRLLMFQTTQEMYRGDRKTTTSIVIDEAWSALKGEGQDATFIEGIARRARKYNGNLITGTQGIDEYYANKGSEAALQNSDWLLILGLKENTIDQAVANKRLPQDTGFLSMVRSLRGNPPLYSEVLISGPPGIAVGRLILDPFTATLFSSKASDFQAIEHLQRQYGLSLYQAVEAHMLHNQTHRPYSEIIEARYAA